MPPGSRVNGTSSFGFQRVERYGAADYNIAVWLAPEVGAGQTLTFTMDVQGTGAANGSHAFVRWLSPTKGGEQIITPRATPE